MWRFFMPKLNCRLNNQVHIFHTLTVLGAGGNDINAGCINTAVTEDVSEFGDVFFDSVKGAGKKVPQIMRKHF